jgi:hypothetical protein
MSDPISYGVDYSSARPTPQSLVDAGYTVVFRYLADDSRGLTAPERDALHAAGLRIALVAESSTRRPLAGYTGGQEDARRYNALADRLDAPATTPIYYCVDVGGGFPALADYPLIRSYFEGLLSIPGRPVGCYGPYPILEDIALLGIDRRVEHHWQTAGGSGGGQGSGGSVRNAGDGSVRRLSKLACAYQEYGGQRITPASATDHNQIFMDPSAWSWHPSDEEEDDMAGAVIQWTKPGSQWAREVAGRAEGDEVAAFLAYQSSGVIVWVRDEAQLNGDRFVGVKDVGPLDDQWFYNYAYFPHGPRPDNGGSGAGAGITEAQAVAAVAHKLTA